jgi:phosphoribosylanthranilate isomerase
MHRTRIKFCGVCRADDARAAAAAGADAVGMILHARSQRLIEAEYAKAVAVAVAPLVAKVGVFVDARAPFVADCARALKLDLVQLHGHESHDFVRALDRYRIVRAVRPDEWDDWRDARLPNLAALLVDSAVGGSGVENDWDAVEAMLRDRPTTLPVILAGGLRPETVGAIVRRFRPFAVDVSSGVEGEPTRKSAEKLAAFATAVRDADADA